VGQQHVLRNSQTLYEGQLLKRSLNTGRMRPFRRTETELDIPDTDLSGVRSNKSTENFDQGRFAGAILTDDRSNLAGRDGDRDILECNCCIEAFGEPVNDNR